MPDQIAIQRGRDFEQVVADKLDGRLQPGSGNKFYAKNDVIAHGLSISCKSQNRFTWGEILIYLSECGEDTNGTGNIPSLVIEDSIIGEKFAVMYLDDFAKAFSEGVKIPEAHESKGMQKRIEIETPLMLRE